MITEKLWFIRCLFTDLSKCTSDYVNITSEKRKIGVKRKVQFVNDKNCCRSALKRKIMYLRQELLNLEKLLDEE